MQDSHISIFDGKAWGTGDGHRLRSLAKLVDEGS